MKKVLIMNDFISSGGAEKVMRDIINELNQKDYDVTILTPNKDNSFDEFFDGKTKYIYFDENPRTIESSLFKKAFKKIKREITCLLNLKKIRKIKYDVAVSFREGDCARYITKVNASKKILWIHDDFINNHWAKYDFICRKHEFDCMKKFDVVACVSQSVLDSVKTVVGDTGNLIVLYNPLNCEEIKVKAQETTFEEKPTGIPLFIALGRIASGKNIPMLIEICSELEKKYLFELWVVGDGEERYKAEKLIEEKHVKSVKLLGNKSNPYPYLAKSDMLISVSRSESFGLNIQEALILGVPVISTAWPALYEIFDEKYGRIVNCEKDKIKDAIIDILEHASLIQEFKNTIENEFQTNTLWESRINGILSIFHS